MSYYQKYLKYKIKYIELQKEYLIGGSISSAKNYFIQNMKKEDTFELFKKNMTGDILNPREHCLKFL